MFFTIKDLENFRCFQYIYIVCMSDWIYYNNIVPVFMNINEKMLTNSKIAI